MEEEQEALHESEEYRGESAPEDLYMLPKTEEKDVKLEVIDKSSVFQYEDQREELSGQIEI